MEFTFKKRNVILTFIIVGILLYGVYWFLSEPLSVTTYANGTEIYVQRLGEYNSCLSEIIIRDISEHKVVWRAVSGKDFIAIWKINIHSGKSSSDLGLLKSDPNIKITVPTNGSTVLFVSGHRYQITIKGDKWFGTRFAIPSSLEFELK